MDATIASPCFGFRKSEMDRLDAMRLFVAVGDAGSLSAAARALKVPLPTVSRKLAQLEEHLGVRLVVRTTRKFVLTEPGRTYLESCRRLLGEIETESAWRPARTRR